MADSPDLISLSQPRFGTVSEAERRLLLAVAKGDVSPSGPNAFSDPANDPAHSDAWGPERQVRAELIRWLCVDPEAKSRVDPRGLQVQGAKIGDPLDLSFVSIPFPLALRRCRLAKTLNLTSANLPALFLSGSWVQSLNGDCLHVEGHVFLRNGFHATGEIRLLGAHIGGNLECHGEFTNRRVDGVQESGKALSADRATVKGSVFLRNGFHAEGEVALAGAEIGGDLDCAGGKFKNLPVAGVPKSGWAIAAHGVDVKGHVLLRDGFHAEGNVRILGAKIGGDLDCGGGVFKNPAIKGVDESGRAISADGIDVHGDVFLRNKFNAEGKVRLLGAQIGGDLDCSGGVFKNALVKDVAQSGRALSAERANVTGSVFLSDGFCAEGEVRLLGAQIGGKLSCTRGKFHNAPAEGNKDSGRALSADGVKVNGDVTLKDGFRAEGEVRLPGADIGGRLECSEGAFSEASGAMILRTAKANALSDEGNESWPAQGKLWLDGFMYDRIVFGPTDAKTRLKWLALQPEFRPQPYRQLAKVLGDAGHEADARTVLHRMEVRYRATGGYQWIRCPWSWILRWTIGYGYRLWLTGVWLLLIVAAGACLFQNGYGRNLVTPTDKDAYQFFRQTGHAPEYYQPFDSIVYSLENSFPLVKLGQADNWRPNRGPNGWTTFATSLQVFRWVQICAGWFLATLFVAGVTGVVRKE